MNANPGSIERTKCDCRLDRVVCFLVGLLLGSIPVIVSLILPIGGDECEYPKTFAAEAQMSSIRSCLIQFKTLNRELPTTEQGLKALYEPPETARVRRKLISPEGIRDPWNKAFGYRYIKEPNLCGYDLWSSGADGEDYSEDDIISRYRQTCYPTAPSK
jgi:hypothetical protein